MNHHRMEASPLDALQLTYRHLADAFAGGVDSDAALVAHVAGFDEVALLHRVQAAQLAQLALDAWRDVLLEDVRRRGLTVLQTMPRPLEVQP